MARLPNPGSDADQWGLLLNEFLRVAHHEDGNLRNTANVLNVRDFGATGDAANTGTDTVAIQAALDAVPAAGGTVYLPAGTYMVDSTLTIQRDRTTVIGEYGATVIQVKNGSSLEHVIFSDRKNYTKICNLTVDANLQGTPRSVAVGLQCSDSECNSVTVTNTVGTTGTDSVKGGVGVGIGVRGDRNRITGCTAINCGRINGAEPQDRQPSDGFYVTGTQNLLIGCIATNCVDTGFVIERSNQSGMIGCTALTCGAGAAITNAQNEGLPKIDAVGNFMFGITIDGWSATVTGGIQIGTLTPEEYHLIDTHVSGIILRNPGTGPAIRVVTQGSGTVKGLVISNITVDGSGKQGLLLLPNVEDVSINGGSIQSGETAVQISETCKNITVQGMHLYVGAANFTRGVAIGEACDSIMVQNCIIRAANPPNTYAWGIYAEGTGTQAARNVRIDGNMISGYLNGAVGAADPATFVNPVQQPSTATDVTALRNDFNTLLANLQRLGILQ